MERPFSYLGADLAPEFFVSEEVFRKATGAKIIIESVNFEELLERIAVDLVS